ncbi:MAG TPA: hypothetical protein H9935_03780 [Candidatus Blautia merdigallinarum]|uniref:MucBP domain-containing protein n=1 Tax=Candidatus Blautia merdigallinarum TaxID=2838495 RepID=A0A9D2N4U2_9FIRM|nr:hypothetical protein [Candidatus Blautia merdigallinarum]
MRKFKKLLTALLSASMALSFSTVSAWAEDYTYTVTFYAGNQGTFANMDDLSVSGKGTPQISMEGDKITVSGLTQGDVISFDVNQGAVSLEEDSKYYVQGLRLSGRDNDEQMEAPAFWVTGDQDYVVAYGIQGDMTSYTVSYVDEDGNELAPSRTYYGNVGDKPVVAYLYMDGYMPQALTLTQTLSANQAENVFTFEYSPNPVEVIPGETVTITTTEPGTTNVITQQVPVRGTGVTGTTGTTGTGTAGTTGTGTGTGTAGTTGDTGTAGTGTAGTTDDGNAAVIGGDNQTGTANAGEDTQAGQAGEEGQTGDGTEEIQDEETPLGQIDLDEGEEEVGETQAEPDGGDSSRGSAFPIAAGVAGVAAAAIVAGGIILLRMRRK